MNFLDKEQDSEQRVFRASLGPFMTFVALAIASVLLVVLVGVFTIVVGFTGADPAVWITGAGITGLALVCAAFSMVFVYHYQFGVILNNESVTLNQRSNPVVVNWDQIAEIYRDKCWFGAYEPVTDEEKELRAKQSWKEKTTGVRLSLIGHQGQTLGIIRSSHYKEFGTLTNIVETKVTQFQGREPRNLDKERKRALKKYRKSNLWNIALEIFMLACCVLYYDQTKKWDQLDVQLQSSGIQTTAELTDHTPLGTHITRISYEFHDQSERLHTQSHKVPRNEWEKRTLTDEIEIRYDPNDPTTNRPVHIPVDSLFSDKAIRIMLIYVTPVIFFPSLLFSLYGYFTNNLQYQTDRYTVVKLGTPKPNQ